jgi:hypothetical protein
VVQVPDESGESGGGVVVKAPEIESAI